MFNQRFKYLEEMAEGGAPEAQPEPEQEQEPEQPSVVPAEEFEKLQAEAQSMRNKMNELLGEKKREQEERRKAQEEAAKKAGDFEQLYKSQEQKAEEYKQELETLRQNIAKEKEQATALKLAGQLADGHNAELLATFMQNRVKYTQDGIKILDQDGNLTVATTDELLSEFKSDARYSALIRGTQSAGGGANGNSGGSGATVKVLSRQEFEKRDADAQMKFIKSGGTLTE